MASPRAKTLPAMSLFREHHWYVDLNRPNTPLSADPTFIIRCMVSGEMFCIISAVCFACSSLIFMPAAAPISLSCSGEMFFIMSLTMFCISGFFICSAIFAIISGLFGLEAIAAGSIPCAFILAAMSIIPFMASGSMFFIIAAACLAILGSTLGIPFAPPIEPIASSCSSDMFSIISAAFAIASGSFIISIAFAIWSPSGIGPLGAGIPVGAAAVISNSGHVPFVSSVRPALCRSTTALSSSPFTVSSPGASFTARRRSATADCQSSFAACACPRR